MMGYNTRAKEVNCLTENETRNKGFYKNPFCDANRLTILGLLKAGKNAAYELLDELHIGPPTLSHHMKMLRRRNCPGT